MYLICDYNERITTASLVRGNIASFRAIAQNATDPEEQRRYAQAAKDAEQLAPVIENQARSIANDLGIDEAGYGRVITREEYATYRANGRKSLLAQRKFGQISVHA